MIRIFIGSSKRFERVEPVIEYSIQKHARVQTEITFLRPDKMGIPETGCTGFTNVRYAIPEVCEFSGFAIYVDVDMLFLADALELYSFKERGRWVQMANGDNEVSVIDCAALRGRLPPMEHLHHFNKSQLQQMIAPLLVNGIPSVWNVEDKYTPNAKLIHFTDLKNQPWFVDTHPNQQAVELWKQYRDEVGQIPIVNDRYGHA